MMDTSLQKLFCIRKCPLTHCVVVFYLSPAFSRAWGDPFIKPSLKNSRPRQLRGAGGRAEGAGSRSGPHAWQLRSFGQMGLPASLSGRRVTRPRSLLPEVRAREERAVGRRIRRAVRGGSTPSPLAACLAAHRWLGSPPPPPLGGWALPRVISAPKVEMRKFPASTDR